MKQFTLLLFFLALSFHSYGVNTNPITEKKLETAYDHILDSYSCDQILNSSIKECKQSSPTKFTFKDRLQVIDAKRNIFNLRNEGKSDAEIKSYLSEENDKSRGAAFALGFLVGLLGVLICYLVDDLKTHVKRAWFGLIFRIGLGLVFGVIYYLIIAP